MYNLASIVKFLYDQVYLEKLLHQAPQQKKVQNPALKRLSQGQLDCGKMTNAMKCVITKITNEQE